MARWGVAVAVSVAAFALTWWACEKLAGLDEGVSLGIVGAVVAVVVAIAGWWPPRAPAAGSRVPRDRG
jgi:hypothetical protein